MLRCIQQNCLIKALQRTFQLPERMEHRQGGDLSILGPDDVGFFICNGLSDQGDRFRCLMGKDIAHVEGQSLSARKTH